MIGGGGRKLSASKILSGSKKRPANDNSSSKTSAGEAADGTTNAAAIPDGMIVHRQLIVVSSRSCINSEWINTIIAGITGKTYSVNVNGN